MKIGDRQKNLGGVKIAIYPYTCRDPAKSPRNCLARFRYGGFRLEAIFAKDVCFSLVLEGFWWNFLENQRPDSANRPPKKKEVVFKNLKKQMKY